MLSRNLLAMLAALFVVLLAVSAVAAESDPLPSWRGLPKQRIIGFVERVTRKDGPDFVRPESRIATFDNDGTLWAEQPFYFQLSFAIDEVKAMEPDHPSWKTQQPFKALLTGDTKNFVRFGETGILKIIAATHAGMTTDQFADTVDKWLAIARHPRCGCPYTALAYQPMLELLAYLRTNGFKTYIVSGGGVEFMRVFAERVYGIPPEQVIGSSGRTSYKIEGDDKPILLKEPVTEFIDDGPGKPEGINRIIGRRPIFAFGNSDGDLEMLEWTASGEGARFAGLVHHTDAAREWSYDRKSSIGKLDRALDQAKARGWTIVDMKKDWSAVFAPSAARAMANVPGQ